MKEETGKAFYDERGFGRFECPSCGSAYWALEERETCTDSPCAPYRIWDAPVFSRAYGMDEMRSTFIDFYVKRGHQPIDPYTVVARWRDDVYLTIASIAAFQPHVTSGTVPPPANPLVISQPCVRLNDLPSVGRTGRHLTSFEMMANHAFNEDGGAEVYWIDQTLRYCHGLLGQLGADEGNIVYKENPWVGGGNGGEAVEVIVGGLELATLVFMHYAEDPAGRVKLKGLCFSPMPRRIVDTGYGLERWVWASCGAPTVYDAAFPDLVTAVADAACIERPDDGVLRRAVTLCAMGVPRADLVPRLASEAGVGERPLHASLERMEDVYTVADHVRTLVRMIGDGIVPSSAKAGYLARLVLRRAERARLRLGLPSLSSFVAAHVEASMPRYADKVDGIVEVLDLDASRFAQTLEKGRRMVERRVAAGLTTADIIEMYDSHGITPDLVAEVAAEKGVQVEIPDDIMAQVAELHSRPETAPATTRASRHRSRPLYHETHEAEFDAAVLAVDGDRVILDATTFYPEGGGQPGDMGVLVSKGRTFTVEDTVKEGGVPVHVVPGHALKAGDRVHGRIDAERRAAHARHHTATHLVMASARNVLGGHVWQTGSQLAEDGARLDVTHFRPITDGEARAIEEMANRAVLADIPVEVLQMARNEADAAYGQRLYQGGPPAGSVVRVVRTGDFEVEACGGTHVRRTGEIGMVRITGIERIQDGVERIHFAAGLAALRAVVEESRLLREASEALEVQPQVLPRSAARFFGEWKALSRRVEELGSSVAALTLEAELARVPTVAGVPIVVARLDDDIAMGMARSLLSSGREAVAIIGTTGGKVLVASSHASVNAAEVVREAAAAMGGGGGGNESLAQGGGPRTDSLEDALEVGRAAATRRLR